jgi:NAD(P)-dependent dehydrogenase (short-subunit alcohol dehydrogenase family)
MSVGTVLVTGGSSGLGAAMAAAILAERAHGQVMGLSGWVSLLHSVACCSARPDSLRPPEPK